MFYYREHIKGVMHKKKRAAPSTTAVYPKCINKSPSLNFEGKECKFHVRSYFLLPLDLSPIPYNKTAASSFIGPSGEDVCKGGSAYST